MTALVLSLLFAAACAKEGRQASATSSKPEFRHDANLQIEDASGALRAEFRIEIAKTEREVMDGLKNREQMDPDHGMLFIFEHLDYHSFWMQDTYLSLDMIFINHENEVVHIEENTTPFSEDPIFPSRPNLYVLEVLAGTVQRLNIKESDIVKWQTLEDL